MSFEINNMQLFSSWSYNLGNCKDCTICRQSLNNPSIYSKNNGSSITKITGNVNCPHYFHNDCIEPWLKNNRHCPNCSKVWESSYGN